MRKLSKVNRDTRAGQKNRIFVQSLFLKPSFNTRGMVATELVGKELVQQIMKRANAFVQSEKNGV